VKRISERYLVGCMIAYELLSVIYFRCSRSQIPTGWLIVAGNHDVVQGSARCVNNRYKPGGLTFRTVSWRSFLGNEKAYHEFHHIDAKVLVYHSVGPDRCTSQPTKYNIVWGVDNEFHRALNTVSISFLN
jgi:hypothetical protein